MMGATSKKLGQPHQPSAATPKNNDYDHQPGGLRFVQTATTIHEADARVVARGDRRTRLLAKTTTVGFAELVYE